MKERPILFNAEMVRAILSGRKTQTRRLVGFPAWMQCYEGEQPSEIPIQFNGYVDMVPLTAGHIESHCKCPFGNIGDHLWVRETFGPCEGGVIYKADESDNARPDDGKWTPSIHMPRWASRLTLKVTDIRVQRVQEISEEDAIAEGCCGSFTPAYCVNGEINGADGEHPYEEFSKLWQSIYGTLYANPWVWAATFEVVK